VISKEDKVMPESKRAIGVLVAVALLLAAPVCIAATDKKDAGGGAKASPSAKNVEKAKESAPEKTVSDEELLAAVEQLKSLVSQQNHRLEAQQQKIDALELKLTEKDSAEAVTKTDATQPGAATASNSPEPQSGEMKKLDDRVTQVETDFGAYKKSNDGKVGRLGPLAFSGDARIRFEPFHGGGPAAATTQARNRYRIRLRFNALAKFSDQVSGGFSLASGDLNDPISTNQTMGVGFTRKPITIDRAFVKYDPKWAHPLSFTAGKQAYSWYRTELTWDNDLNPEGVSETLSWNFKDSPVQRIAFVGFQGPVVEVSAGKDTFLYVSQFQSNFKFGEYVKLGTYVGYYNFQNADPLRAARAAGTVGGSSNTNAAATTGNQYESKFGLFNAIGRLDFKTPSARLPVWVLFDYVRNTRACDNLPNIALGNQTACNARDNSGYWAEIQFGRTAEQGDINFGYTFIRLEKEATLDAFNFSDLRAPTNIFNHRVIFNYQAYRNVQLGFTGLFGRPLVVGAATKENILKRLQFDVVYKF
jgi:putative porin